MEVSFAAKLPHGELSRVAGETDRSPSHIKRILDGQRQPSLDLAAKLAELGHSVWHLYPDLKGENGNGHS